MKIRIKEAQQTPQAIFMAGPAGAGKSFIAKSLPLSKFQVINVDDTYEELLKASGMGMKQKDFSPEE
jgi:dephospho-CoA kinase